MNIIQLSYAEILQANNEYSLFIISHLRSKTQLRIITNKIKFNIQFPNHNRFRNNNIQIKFHYKN